jgi:hypothetical protein
MKTARRPIARAFSARAFSALAFSAAVGGHGAAGAAEACAASSGPTATPVVELYTSEGCNSCPPADRWLSTLKASPDLVALAFHVDYWDRLGWKDRFASAAFTNRQATQQASTGTRFSYTPQVVVAGRDRKDWRSIDVPGASRPPVDVALALARQGDGFVATVRAGSGAPKQLAGYWAVTEQGHVSVVNAGENDGSTLRHDFVVRDYAPVQAWAAPAGTTRTWHFKPASAAEPAHPRSINFVVVDPGTGRPVQALKLAC